MSSSCRHSKPASCSVSLPPSVVTRLDLSTVCWLRLGVTPVRPLCCRSARSGLERDSRFVQCSWSASRLALQIGGCFGASLAAEAVVPRSARCARTARAVSWGCHAAGLCHGRCCTRWIALDKSSPACSAPATAPACMELP